MVRALIQRDRKGSAAWEDVSEDEFPAGLWCKRFEVGRSRRREVALDHAARTAFQILGAVLPLAPSLPSLN